MKTNPKLRALFLILVYCISILDLSSQRKTELKQITGSLYLITGLGGNVAFLTTNDGVLVVDAGTLPDHAEEIKKYISTVSSMPIKYLVLTNHHYDHTFGLCAFKNNATIISHKNAAENLKKFGLSSKDYFTRYLKSVVNSSKVLADSLKLTEANSWQKADSLYKGNLSDYNEAKAIKICYPDSVFETILNLHLGNDTIQLYYPGPTYSDGNILVIFKNQDAIATGDFFFNQLMPYIDYSAGSNTLNWIQQAQKVAAWGFKYIIPGHGAVSSGDKLIEQAEYLDYLRSQIYKLHEKGLTVDEIKSSIDMKRYKHFGLQYMLPVEINAIVEEFKIDGAM